MTDAAAVRAAARRIAGHVRRTPLLEDEAINAAAGRRVLLKAECLQVTGSFKARGAWNAVAALVHADAHGMRTGCASDVHPHGRTLRGVVAASSGNHAQGLARAAAAHGLPCTILMPSDAPAPKRARTEAWGARIVAYDRAAEDRDERFAALVAEEGLTPVPPFDHAEVIAGQGTVGLEIAEQCRALGVTEADVLVCTGGGGLLAGIALALEAEAPGLRPRPVEPEGFDDVSRSLRSGRRERNARTAGSLCDAILTAAPGALTFPVIARLCGPGLSVTDAAALAAMRAAFEGLRLAVEPGGAVALAAALAASDLPDTVVVTLSGGNVDPALLCRALGPAA